jgi:replicative DNA helicase
MSIVFNPQETSRLSVERLKFRRDNKDLAVPLGLASIDEYFNPCLPGDLVTVIGRPGSGKTGFMLRWARYRADQLQKQKAENRVIVYVTYEQHIEDLNSIQIAADEGVNVTKMARGEIGDDDWKKILKSATRRAAMPIWYVGHSMANRQSRPRITPSVLIENLQKLEADRGVVFDIIFVDYLQRIPFDGKHESKVVGTSYNLDAMKDFALVLNCPFCVGVQARREVDLRQLPIPGMDDGQWTSNIEQASDKIFTTVRPAKYRKEGEMFGKNVTVEGHCQMLVTLAKQKMGPDNKAQWVYFDPAYNKMDELEMKNYNPALDIDEGWKK